MARRKSDRPQSPVAPAAYTPANQPASPESAKLIARLRKAILACLELPESERVAAYNAATSALRSMVADLCNDPVLAVRLVPAGKVVPNEYNPNRVASPEVGLVEASIREDGVTMPVATAHVPAAGTWVVVDGFHRRSVLVERLGRKYVPCSVIDKPISDRMASTIRHNRARGKHQVDLMAEIVKALLSLGWGDDKIAEHIGMTPEELLRLKQSAGVAELLAGSEYSKSWGPKGE